MSQKIFKLLNNRKILGLIVAAGGAFWAFNAPVMAVIINPGQSNVATTGIISYGGTLLIDTGPQSFTGNYTPPGDIAFTGDLDTKVYSDPSNPFGAGDLDFVYQFTNIDSDNPDDDDDPINHFSIASYSGVSTDADYVAGSGVGSNFPSTMSRNTQNAGDTIDFNFPVASVVLPGQTSVQLVIDTNAKAWNYDLASIQGGGNVSIAAPAPVPEPATVAIAGFAMCALGMRRRNAARS
jgi:hypothetical protein